MADVKKMVGQYVQLELSDNPFVKQIIRTEVRQYLEDIRSDIFDHQKAVQDLLASLVEFASDIDGLGNRVDSLENQAHANFTSALGSSPDDPSRGC